MNTSIFYVYQYLTEDGTPFYIGKGSKNRINESHAPWIMIPPVEQRQIIQDNLTEKDAFDLEIALIKQHGRKIDGGILDNIKISRWVAQAGWHHSEETKNKISKKNKGRVCSEEFKQKLRKPKTKDHAEKIRMANLGRQDDGRNKKISESMKGRPWSEARRNAQLKKKEV